MTGHRYLSASSDILRALPDSIVKTFPIVMQQRSGFTERLYDYLITGIYQGQNFMELSEGIGSMNYRVYMRNNLNSEVLKSGNYEDNTFCSYSSNDKLMEFFLMHFERNKQFYERNMQRHTRKILACDHAFRTSKHVGITRDDDKFVGQFQNVFLSVNENGEVLTWKFTKTTAFSEITDSLKELKERLDRTGTNLEMITVDDCCHVKNLYGQVFPGVKIRLDVFHACMRVVQTVPKSEDFSKKFANDFSLIFRRNGDLGEERTMDTPCPEELEANLERLLFVWRDKLPKETLFQIENLRKHIQQGCLSDIPVGCGTEKNERLHRHLNRSLLCGVSKIGLELAVAVMTCVLYAWNCKRKEKKFSNKRTTPVLPIELEASTQGMNSSSSHVNTTTPSPMSSPSLSGNNSEITGIHATETSSTCKSPSYALKNSVEELKTNLVLNYILQRVLHLQEFYNTLIKKCNSKTLDLIALLWPVKLTTVEFCKQESELNTMEFDLTAQHLDNLIRNLSGFRLKVDQIPKDGNCFFRATARQLHKHFILQGSDELTRQHILSVGLGKSEELDAKNLRLLFVKELNENINEYKEWTSSTSAIVDIERFKKDGFFASEIGDLCAKVCANILRIPIVLITALPTVPSIPFLPKVFVTTTPIYLAYDHSGPGHYDATKGEKIFTRSSFYDNSYYYCAICYKLANSVHGVNHLLGETPDIKVARNSFHFVETSFTNSFLRTAWLILPM